MKFNNCEEFIEIFNALPKDKTISYISNGNITKYISDTYLNSIEIIYSKENTINLLLIGVKQDGLIKKIKIYPYSKFEIKFRQEDLSKEIENKDDSDLSI